MTQQKIKIQLDKQHPRFRDTMVSLLTAVSVITIEDDAGQCGITATAVCSVADTPPSLMVCINANSMMNPVFQDNGKLHVNVLSHEQELMARHFAGITGAAMEEHFSLSCWRKGPLAQPVLKGSLVSLRGEIRDMQAIGAHLVYLVEIKNIILSAEGHGLICLKRRPYPVMLEIETAI